MYETFEHTADLGLRVRAASLDELFAEAGRGFFSMIVANLDEVRPVIDKTFHVTGTDHELLLFDWLTELLFAFESEKLLLVEFQITLDSEGLKAMTRGERLDPARHQLEHEVKAITYHALSLEQTTTGWQAEVIVDI